MSTARNYCVVSIFVIRRGENGAILMRFNFPPYTTCVLIPPAVEGGVIQILSKFVIFRNIVTIATYRQIHSQNFSY